MVPGIKVICPELEEMAIINEVYDGQDLLFVPLLYSCLLCSEQQEGKLLLKWSRGNYLK